MNADSYIAGAAYELGEERRVIVELKGFDELLSERQVPCLPGVMGFGAYFATSDPYGMVMRSVQRTLASTAFSPAEVDCVIVSSSNLPDKFAPQNRAIGSVLLEQGLNPRSTYAISGTGCVALLSAVDLALRLLSAHAFDCVLIVEFECIRTTDDRVRFFNYAMVSDSAASLLVTSQFPNGLQFGVAGLVNRSNAPQMVSGIRWDTPDLGLAVVTQVLDNVAINISDITKVLANNTFLPIKKNRERALGFQREQLYLNNTPRIAHCLAADPLINWVDCVAETGHQGPYLLYAEADGHSAAMVISGKVAQD